MTIEVQTRAACPMDYRHEMAVDESAIEQRATYVVESQYRGDYVEYTDVEIIVRRRLVKTEVAR